VTVNLRGRAWAAYLTTALLAIAIYVALRFSALGEGVFYAGFNLIAVVAIVVGARIHRPPAVSAWYLIALSQLLFVAGDITWTTFDLVGIDTWPSFADAFYLAGYPVLAAGVLGLIRARRDTGDRRALIDASIVALGLGILAWVFLIDPYIDDRSLSTIELLISIAYPLGDILVMAVAVRLAVGGSSRAPSFAFLGASLVALLAADVVYGMQQLGTGYVNGGWLDGLWMLSYGLLATTALHPSVPRLSRAEDVQPPTGRRRLVILAGAALLAPLAMVLQGSRGYGIEDVWVLSMSAAGLFLLVVARMAGLVREVEGVVDELTVLQDERKQLLDRTMQAQEEERMRIAAELHDGPLQRLASLGHGLERVRLRLERGDSEDARTVLEPIQDSLTSEVQSLREIMSAIRPPALDEQGLEGALQDELAASASRIGAEWHFRADLEERLDPEIETTVYRVAQEALRNVGKHAAASRIEVDLRQENGHFEFALRDDGAGFDVPDSSRLVGEGRFGLVSMQERVRLAGGTCTIESKPGAGTTVRARFDGGMRT
jgi:signal transduction histidine kinase